MHLFVLRGSDNKQQLFPYTALTYGFYNRGRECLLRGTTGSLNQIDSFVLKGLSYYLFPSD